MSIHKPLRFTENHSQIKILRSHEKTYPYFTHKDTMVKTTSPTNMTLMTMYEHLKTCNLCSITKLYIFTQVQEFFNVIGCSHCVQGSNILTCTKLDSISLLRMIIKSESTKRDWENYETLCVFLSYFQSLTNWASVWIPLECYLALKELKFSTKVCCSMLDRKQLKYRPGPERK